MVIAIEGLPGAGKTTSATLLAKQLGVDALIETTGDHPFLDSVYDDRNRHDLQIELAFLVLHFGGYRVLDRRRTVVADFSPGKDLLFAWDMLHDEDLSLFERAYERLYEQHPRPDVVLFLDLPPADCLIRVRERGRGFERGMKLERLQRMRALYDRHLQVLGDTVLRVPLTARLTPDQVTDRLLKNLGERRLAYAG